MALPAHIHRIRKNEFILVSEQNAKTLKVTYHVVRVKKVLDESVLGTLIRDSHKRDQSVEIQLRDVVANLGETPPPIKIAGTDLEEYFPFETEHKQFGQLWWSFDPADNEDAVKRVHRSFSATYEWLKANGLEDITQLPIHYEIGHKVQKMMGCYWNSGGGRLAKKEGVLRFNPNHPEAENVESTVGRGYLTSHEIAHVIDTELLFDKPKHRARWIDLYQETVSPLEIPAETCDALLEKMLVCESLKDFRAAIKGEEDDKEAVKAIFEHIHKTHNLGAYDVETLMRAGQAGSIREVWPQPNHTIVLERKPIISDYSLKNVRELFAESLSYGACGKKLPKKVTELSERALELARKNLPLVLQGIKDAVNDENKGE